ncbi:MAG: DUF89 family protein [Thermoplasmata archaeon]|nr:DUF89 family protein [Thermoplasmata archaeon]
MRADPQCIPCLLRRALYEANLVDPKKAAIVVAETTRILAEEYDPDAPEVSAKIASKLHSRVYEILGTDNPYKDVKRGSNEAAASLLPRAREMIERSEKPWHTAALISVAGNLIEFGISGAAKDPEEFLEMFGGVVREGFTVDDTEQAFSLLGPGKKAVYLIDNCGEIVLDSLFWDVLRAEGAEVTVVVKGKPILTDATMDDVRDMALEEHADHFITTGSGAVGLEPSSLPLETEKAMREADLIISKGMGNFEALSEEDYRPILYLMRTKCEPIANHANAPLNVNVAKLYV